MTSISSHPQHPTLPRMDAQSVLQALEEMSQTLQPGDPLPTQVELIRRFNASDRAVRWALDELRRQGKIVSRRRLGTVIAPISQSQTNPFSANQPHSNDYSATSINELEIQADVPVSNRTVVAIAVPGQTVFSRALNLLFRQTESLDLPLVCRLFDPKVSNVPTGERPLGYVLLGRGLIPLGRELQDAGHRVAVVGTPYADSSPGVPCVYGDQEHGGYVVTKHLIDLGHRSIAFRGDRDWPQMRRWRGQQLALAESQRRGVEVQESHIFEEEFEQWRRTPEAAVTYFRRPDAPTAVVAWNDQAAMTLLSLLSYVHVRVPQEVSLVGYDNLPESQQVHPSLTTVDVALEQQLRAALRLLTQPEMASPSQQIMVTSTLIRRESTATAAR